jgi:hypothetical protein
MKQKTYRSSDVAMMLLAEKDEAPRLAAENERLREALWFSLNTLRLVRDGYPAAWDSFMASEAGPDMATVWDKLKAALSAQDSKG